MPRKKPRLSLFLTPVKNGIKSDINRPIVKKRDILTGVSLFYFLDFPMDFDIITNVVKNALDDSSEIKVGRVVDSYFLISPTDGQTSYTGSKLEK